MLWTQADWLSIPTALTSFAAVQEWEAGSLVQTYGALGSQWIDTAIVWLAQSTVALYLNTPHSLLTATYWAKSIGLASAFRLDAALTAQMLAPSLMVGTSPVLSQKAALALDVVGMYSAATQHWLDFYVCSALPAQMYSTVLATSPTWLTLIQSVDPILLCVELFFVAVACFSLDRWVAANSKQVFYDDIVTLCKYNNVSLTEVAVTLTLVVGFVFFDIFVSFAEDDVIDTLNYLILLFIVLTFVFLLIAVDLQYFFMVSNAGGDVTLRVICFDLINNLLCALRVFFCWIRYIFYDLQVELVDMTFQYSDSINEVALTSWFDTLALNTVNAHSPNAGSLWASSFMLIWVLVATFFDIACYVLQALTGLFKLVIASFLLWLIVDLFLLRGFALDESQGLASARAKKNL